MLSTARTTRRVGALAGVLPTVGTLDFLGVLGLAFMACSSGGAPPGGPDAAMPVMDGGGPGDAATRSHDAGVTDSGSDLAMVGSDLAVPADLARPVDLSASVDSAMVPADLTVPTDLARTADLSAPVDLVTTPDLAFPSAQGVSIYVDNTCRMDVIPKSIDVPRGVTLKLTFNNRSRDYAVDVWMSYGGGYTDLATGRAWVDPIEHCRLPRPYYEYADISTACSKYQLMIHCL